MAKRRAGQTGGGVGRLERHSEGAEVLQVLLDGLGAPGQSRVSIGFAGEDAVEARCR